MKNTRHALRRLETSRTAQSAAPLPSDSPRPYTEAEWNYFVVTPDVLRREGPAAAERWVRDHPRPDNVPDWLLEEVARCWKNP